MLVFLSTCRKYVWPKTIDYSRRMYNHWLYLYTHVCTMLSASADLVLFPIYYEILVKNLYFSPVIYTLCILHILMSRDNTFSGHDSQNPSVASHFRLSPPPLLSLSFWDLILPPSRRLTNPVKAALYNSNDLIALLMSLSVLFNVCCILSFVIYILWAKQNGLRWWTRRSVCLRRRTFVWPWPLTHDLESLSSTTHSHVEYLCQILFKSLH